MQSVVLVAVALALAPATVAGGPPPPGVVAVPGLGAAEVGRLAGQGAVGLVVPDAGPTTSEARALSALERGEVTNSLRGGSSDAPRRLRATVDRTGSLALRGGRFRVGIPRGGRQSHDRRYAIVRPGDERGLLTSESTRIPGLVAIADIAYGRLRVEPHARPAAYLRDLDRRITDNARTRRVTPALVVVAAGLAALVTVWAGLAAFGTVLCANLLLGTAGLSHPVVVALLLVLAVAAAVPLGLLAERLPPARRDAVVGAALVGVVALYLAAMATDATWVALAPFGPTQNARFYGLSNLVETIVLVPALAGAALLARRWGLPALLAAAALALVTVAGSRFGADGGGALVLAAGYAVLGAGLAGTGRRALLVAAGVAAAAVAVAALDALLGPSTHVGETVRGGPLELARDLGDRVELSWRRATDSWELAAVVFGAIAALAVAVARGPRRALPLAVAVAVAVSLIVNDSPRDVSVGGLVAYLLVARLERRSDEEAAVYNRLRPPRRTR